MNKGQCVSFLYAKTPYHSGYGVLQFLYLNKRFPSELCAVALRNAR